MRQKYKFPEGFLWGASSSAHQTEGNNTNSDWWAWENSQKREAELRAKGLEPEKYKSGTATDGYNRFDEDFALANTLKHNATRISLEWARIEPKEGQFNEEAFMHYEKVLQSAKFYGLKTFVTLHHFTNPLWFAKKGGFENIENVQFFIRYASKVAERLHENVDFWLTINEPEVYCLLSYLQGVFPPQKKSFRLARRVAKNLILAHNFSVREIKFFSRSPVSLAFHLSHVVANGLIGQFLVKMYNRWLGHYFIDQTIKFCDFIGVNYYFQHRIGRPNLGKPALNPDLKTDIGWEIHPEGLEPVLLGLKKYQKPIYITENGIADRQDYMREQFIKAHLFYAHRAIANGVDLRGYLYWSLTDNFEWEKGFGPKFGLIAVDRERNFKRQVRFSAIKFAEICWNNFLEY
jgi:beta-glucosidase